MERNRRLDKKKGEEEDVKMSFEKKLEKKNRLLRSERKEE